MLFLERWRPSAPLISCQKLRSRVNKRFRQDLHRQTLSQIDRRLFQSADAFPNPQTRFPFGRRVSHVANSRTRRRNPPLRLLRARIALAEAKAKGRRPPLSAGRDLAAYVASKGWNSEASREAIGELKSAFASLWQSMMDTTLFGNPGFAGNRLFNAGQGIGANMQIVGLNPSRGESAWRLPAQRFVDSVAVGSRLF